MDVLKEILRWVKFSGMKEVRAILTSVLDDEQKRMAYQLSDGSKGMVEVGKQVGIKSTGTMFKLWKQWAKVGLGESVSVPGGQRFKRSFDLEDFGIKINMPEATENETKVPTEESPKPKAPGATLEEFQASTGVESREQ